MVGTNFSVTAIIVHEALEVTFNQIKWLQTQSHLPQNIWVLAHPETLEKEFLLMDKSSVDIQFFPFSSIYSTSILKLAASASSDYVFLMNTGLTLSYATLENLVRVASHTTYRNALLGLSGCIANIHQLTGYFHYACPRQYNDFGRICFPILKSSEDISTRILPVDHLTNGWFFRPSWITLSVIEGVESSAKGDLSLALSLSLSFQLYYHKRIRSYWVPNGTDSMSLSSDEKQLQSKEDAISKKTKLVNYGNYLYRAQLLGYPFVAIQQAIPQGTSVFVLIDNLSSIWKIGSYVERLHKSSVSIVFMGEFGNWTRSRIIYFLKEKTYSDHGFSDASTYDMSDTKIGIFNVFNLGFDDFTAVDVSISESRLSQSTMLGNLLNWTKPKMLVLLESTNPNTQTNHFHNIAKQMSIDFLSFPAPDFYSVFWMSLLDSSTLKGGDLFSLYTYQLTFKYYGPGLSIVNVFLITLFYLFILFYFTFFFCLCIQFIYIL